MQISANRAGTAAFLAVLSILLMWALALGSAFLAYYYLERAPRGQMPAEIVVLGVATVFAMGFVRNAAPGWFYPSLSLPSRHEADLPPS